MNDETKLNTDLGIVDLEDTGKFTDDQTIIPILDRAIHVYKEHFLGIESITLSRKNMILLRDAAYNGTIDLNKSKFLRVISPTSLITSYCGYPLFEQTTLSENKIRILVKLK